MSMAPSDHPETTAAPTETTGIQTPPPLPVSSEVTPLPPPPVSRQPAIDREEFLRQRGRFDVTLIGLVLAFAFLIASFPVANPDFFRQVAIGRLLLEGNYHFGVDPFVYTGDGVYWVNHSWLFAILSYALYQLPGIGAIAVVVFKAVITVLVAELLLRAGRRKGQSLWIPAACTLLAVLALSPRLYYQSTCFSFLFLALTVWLLHRPHLSPREGATAEDEAALRSWWLLPPLFALWVNCDSWFFLGPLTVALYLAGELIQQRLPTNIRPPNETRQGEIARLGLVLLVGLAACLLNPHHVHAFTLPVELGLSPAGDWLETDSQFGVIFLSPLSKKYYEPNLGLSVAGLSYLPLLVVGVISFACLYRRLPVERLTVWLGFALLSLYSVRAIPFFAIVAGPITALNWLDFAAERLGPAPLLTRGWRTWSLGGRLLTIVLTVALLLLTVPGWLQAQPRDSRRVGWFVYSDPALEQTARTIDGWRQEKRLPVDPHWFNLNQEIANYLAWYAHGERAFLDKDLPYFRTAAADYIEIRDALEQTIREPEPAAGEQKAAMPRATAPKEPKDLRKLLRKHHVHYWIFDNNSTRKANQAAQDMLFANPEEWVLCSVAGRIAIFAWKDPEEKEAPDPSEGLKLDLARLAFGPDAVQAPPKGPEPVGPPQEGWENWLRDAWNVWWHPGIPNYAARENAILHENRFEGDKRYHLTHDARVWQRTAAASAVGLSVPSGTVLQSLLPLSWSFSYSELFPSGAVPLNVSAQKQDENAMRALMIYVLGQDHGPPASLYLGLRSARRALLTDPEDPLTNLLLAHFYMRLADQQRERPSRTLAPRLGDIRRTQMIAALHNCVRAPANPMVALEAHLSLYSLLKPLGYVDMQANHLREALQLRRTYGAPPGVTAEQFGQVLKSHTDELTKIEAEVKQRQDQFEVATTSRPPLARIQAALERGLAETAWNELKQIDPEEMQSQAGQFVKWEMIRVFLDLGWLYEASQLLVPDPEQARESVAPDYVDYRVRLAAGRGDYDEADRLLAEALNYSWPGANAGNQMYIAGRIGRVLLVEGMRAAGVPRLPWVPNDPRTILPFGLTGEARGQSPSEFWVRRWQFETLTSGIAVQQRRSEWHLLRGCLALEAGRCEQARQSFESVLQEVVPEERWSLEVRRLNALFDVPGQSNDEQRRLETTLLQQRFLRNYAQYHAHWLDVYQRKPGEK